MLEVVSLKRAIEIVSDLPVSRKTERVLLDMALGRVVSEDLNSSIDVPPFDRAAMDGFAVRAGDTFHAVRSPVTLHVRGLASPGEKPSCSVEKSSCVGISTGTPMPPGADAVVMVEHTDMENDDEVWIYKPVAPGENVMEAGSDIKKEEICIRKGTRLTPRETGVLAASGFAAVPVYRKPCVAIISTGDEIVPTGEELSFGKIYDVNARTIADSVRESGGEPKFLGIVEDEEWKLKKKVEEGLRYDIVIASGSTSAGIGDILYKIIGEMGKILVHGVAIKPGKPTLIGVCRDKPIFCLPGYPTSALITFNVFVSPLIRRISGVRASEKRRIYATTKTRIYSAGGRYEYSPMKIVFSKGKYEAYPILSGSGAISTLKNADAYIEIPENVEMMDEDEEVEVELISNEIVMLQKKIA
jgi:molybdenum cofactor synthesis domain-containing protein